VVNNEGMGEGFQVAHNVVSCDLPFHPVNGYASAKQSAMVRACNRSLLAIVMQTVEYSRGFPSVNQIFVPMLTKGKPEALQTVEPPRSPERSPLNDV